MTYVVPKQKSSARRLWQDQDGAAITIELILMASVIGVGAIVGLVAFRDSVSQEFGDAAAGLSSIDQGYRYDAVSSTGVIDNVTLQFDVSGSSYVDQPNFCEPAVVDPVGDSPMCMQISAASIQDEG